MSAIPLNINILSSSFWKYAYFKVLIDSTKKKLGDDDLFPISLQFIAMQTKINHNLSHLN